MDNRASYHYRKSLCENGKVRSPMNSYVEAMLSFSRLSFNIYSYMHEVIEIIH